MRTSPQFKRVLSGRSLTHSKPMHSTAVISPEAVGHFDIFDAPHNLGEAAAILGFAPRRLPAAPRAAPPSTGPTPVLYDGPSWSKQSMSTMSTNSAAGDLITSLPSGVIYDGPARPSRHSHSRSSMTNSVQSLSGSAPSHTLLPAWMMRAISTLQGDAQQQVSIQVLSRLVRL